MGAILAHFRELNDGSSIEESLAEHLAQTACRTRQFASAFNASKIGDVLARCHDLGKASGAFQTYIRTTAGDSEETEADGRHRHGPDHSSAGAQELARRFPGLGLLLAYAVAGHHAGLPDGRSNLESGLVSRLEKAVPPWASEAHDMLEQIDKRFSLDELGAEVRPFLMDGYACGFFIRMMFSCLVDGDFLATEDFMDGVKAAHRQLTKPITLAELQQKLNVHYDALLDELRLKGLTETPVNIIRQEVLEDCRAAAELPPGLFSLTVPTGGGKTLASMAFALKHAVRHGLERVIYVIPYTSIIEQNAKVFREILGEEAVLEHHCLVEAAEGSRAKLTAENWDAPIIVTTNVQFFESIYAHRTSRCRKLHNLANAVIILDEVQTLPTGLLTPCLRVLDELVLRYGTSVVLCTATQPAILNNQIKRGGLTGGDCGCREIIARERELSSRLNRVTVERIPGKISDDDLIKQFSPHEQCLTIVSTRRHAKELFEKTREKVPGGGVFHLSAQMCPAHRTDVLNQIRRRLAEGTPCRVIATQLIEAGVDIDFPCVFREIAGLDSCAQAAGRCNREGRMTKPGAVFLFESADFQPPAGFLRTAAQIGKEVLDLPGCSDGLLSPEAVHHYFTLLYSDQEQSLDTFSVMQRMPVRTPREKADFFSFQFRTLGEQFKMIDEVSVSVFIPYDDAGKALCEALRKTYATGEQRKLARKLQRYAVNLYGREPCDKNGNLIAEKIHDAYWVMSSPQIHYSDDFGVVVEGLTTMLNV